MRITKIGIPPGGSTNQVLVKSSGTDYDVEWGTGSGTATPPGGLNTQVQFNDGGVFGGDAGFTYNKTTNRLTLGSLVLNDVVDPGVDTDKFLVLTSLGVVSYRNGASVLVDIGGVPTTRTLTINGTSYDLSQNRTWSVGTVYSVGLSAPTGFTVANSPVTGTGTLALSFASGYSLPTTASQTNWDTAYTNRITSLTTTGSSGAATLVSNTLNIPNYTLAGLGGFANPMTTLGDVIYGAASGVATRLGGNTTTAKQYLSQTGTGTVSAAPSWAAIDGADVTGAALTKTDDTNVTLTLGGTPSTSLLRAASLTLGWTGQLAVSRGGTGLSTLGTANQLLRVNSGATALEYWTPTYISSAITSLGGLTAATQTFATGTSGTDFNINSATSTHTFNLPTASATNRGALSSADWSTFNGKENVLTFSSPLSRSTNTISIPAATGSVNGYLTSTDWTTFNGKQAALNGTGFVKISGTTISYDNSTYYLASNPNGYTSNVGTVISASVVSANGFAGTVATATTTPAITLTTTVTGLLKGNGTAISAAVAGTDYQAALTNPVTGTGSSGQVAYFNGTTSITSESNLFWDASNDRLGIGTNTPSTALHILKYDSTINPLSFSNTSALILQNTYGSLGDSGSAIFFKSDTGTYNTFAGIAGNMVGSTASGSWGALIFGTKATAADTSLTERMRITSGGNVGIGTDNPTLATLQVVKAGAAQSDAAGGILTRASDGDKNWISIGNYSTVGSSYGWIQASSLASLKNLVLNPSGGNVLIGTTTDAGYKLDVNGTGRFASTNYSNIIVDGTNSTGWGTNIAFRSEGTDFGYIGSVGSLLGNTTKDLTLWATSGNGIRLYTNGNNLRATLDSSGNLGLGVTPSAWDASFKVLQIGTFSSVYSSPSTYLGHNIYYNSGNKYTANGYALLYGLNDSGQFVWYNAPNNTSGAGAALTFTQAMTLDANGKLLIGTTDSTNVDKVRINNDGTSAYSTVRFTNTNSTGNLYIGVGGNSVGNTPLRNNAYLMNEGASSLLLGTSGIVRQSIAANGQLKLNAYTATGSFTGTTTGYLAFTNTGDVITKSPAQVLSDIGGGSGTIGGSTGSVDNAILRADGTGGATVQSSAILLDDDANLQLGTTSVSSAQRSITASGSANDIALVLFSKNSGRIRLQSAGYINLTSNGDNNYRTQIEKDASAIANAVVYPLDIFTYGFTSFVSGIGTGLRFFVNTGTNNNEYGAAIDCICTDTTATSEDFDLTIKTMAAGLGPTERVRIKSTGQLQLNNYTSTSSFTGTEVGTLGYDASGNILSLGLTTTETKNSWTPAFSNSGASISYATNGQVGYYVKQGSMVTVTFRLELGAGTSMTGNALTITTLPFTSVNTTNQEYTCAIAWTSSVTNFVNAQARISPNSTTLTLLKTTAAGANSTTAMVGSDIGTGSVISGTITYFV